MELPNDILEHLENFIKPKRYNLINKFCRDFYFRKNGVVVELDKKYRDTDLYRKYSVKIIDRRVLPDTLIHNHINNTVLQQKVTEIKCISRISVIRYKTLLETFPNLRKLKCKLDSYKTDKIIDRGLDGAKVEITNQTDPSEILRLTNRGYKLKMVIVDRNWYGDIPSKGIVSVSDPDGKIAINIKKLPYIKKIHTNAEWVSKMKEDIISHPSLIKIRYTNTSIPLHIIKKDGTLIEAKVGNYDDRGNIKSFKQYELVKKYYDTILVSANLDKLIEYEKLSQIRKRIKLILYNGLPDHIRVEEILELFKLQTVMFASQLHSWIRDPGLYSTKMLYEKIIFKFPVGDKKLEVYIGVNF